MRLTERRNDTDTPRVEEQDWSGLERFGGVALVAAAILGIVILGMLLPLAGGLPSDAEHLLDKAASRAWLIHLVAVLYVLLDLCLVGALPALYVALRSVNRTWPLVAGLVAAVALMADINSGLWVYALPDLGNASVAATTAARAGYTASGQLLYSYIYGSETRFYVSLLSLAVSIFSLTMLRGEFNRGVAYLGILLGLAGVVLGLIGFIPVVVLLSLWFLPTGIKLYRLG